MSRYIDADKLKEHYMWWGGGFTANCKDGQKEVKKIFDEIIDLQPTADVRENVNGEWIERKPMNFGKCVNGLGSIFICSVCGEEISCCTTNFCPNCGADMRGET